MKMRPVALLILSLATAHAGAAELLRDVIAWHGVRLAAGVSSSRSARRATTSCDAFRPFSVARSRMVIWAQSSTGRSPSF